MNKMLIVAVREYLSTVRRTGFIITTLGMPIFFVCVYGVAGGAALWGLKSSREQAETVGVVDESGLVRFDLLERVKREDPPPEPATTRRDPRAGLMQGVGTLPRLAANVSLRPFISRAEARSAFMNREVRGYYIVPADFLDTGTVELELKKGPFLSNSEPAWAMVRRLVQASLVEGRLEPRVARRLWTPSRLRTVGLTDAGAPDKRGTVAEISSFAVPYVTTLFFLLSIMSSAGYLLQGVAEEKENRVIEMLLSSLTTDQLLAGKVIGLCGAGLTQIATWVLIGVAPSLYLLPFLELRWSQLVVALLFFLLGFLLYGSLMGGSGALGNNFKESQQASIAWTLAAIVPLFFMTVVLTQPNGTFARVLSYIPFTAPITVMLRVAAGPVPWWDIALSAGILLASLFLFLRLAARLFRLGSLMYGKRPSAVEIIKWLRVA